MRVKENVKIYTDGSCHGNPGPGGYFFSAPTDQL